MTKLITMNKLRTCHKGGKIEREIQRAIEDYELDSKGSIIFLFFVNVSYQQSYINDLPTTTTRKTIM